MMKGIAKTISLFLPFFTDLFPRLSETENLEFMAKIANYVVPPRNPAAIGKIPITVADVRNGDIFASLKLMGIDPIITALTGIVFFFFQSFYVKKFQALALDTSK